MTDIIKQADTWFVNLLVISLAAYFLWSIKGLFRDLKQSITDLKELIRDLYEHRNDHEVRIVTLETRCKIKSCDDQQYEHQRMTGGRRSTDPPVPP